MDYHHTPVLLKEVLQYLDPKPGDTFVDATLGGGGYSKALLEAVGSKGTVLSIDLDPAAIAHFKKQITRSKYQSTSIVVRDNFRDIAKISRTNEVTNIAGVVADLGLSSFELDDSGRGFSFQKTEPLDMRFDPSQDTTAAFILNNETETELAKIFRNFGEEPHSGRLAKAIVAQRLAKPFADTSDLLEAIRRTVPARKANDTARRIFQAVRIAVNHELDSLSELLPAALDVLAPGGRLAVVTFHSLEDRMVKQFFAQASKGCVCPPEFPLCRCGKNPELKIVTKKPVTPVDTELISNPRSRSAKLRAVIKI